MYTIMSMRKIKRIEDFSIFGSYTELLQLRIPKELYKALESMAQKDNMTLPDLVRWALTVFTLPYLLKQYHGRLAGLYSENALSRLSEKEAHTEAVEILVQLDKRLTSFLQGFEDIKNLQKGVIELKSQLNQSISDYLKKWDGLINSYLAEYKEVNNAEKEK